MRGVSDGSVAVFGSIFVVQAAFRLVVWYLCVEIVRD